MKTVTATIATAASLLLALAACTPDATPADSIATPTATPIAITLGDKPAYATTQPTTRTNPDDGSWQVGDRVTATLTFYTTTAAEADATPEAPDTPLGTQTQLLTCTAAPAPDGTPAKWSASPLILLAPAGARSVLATYAYASAPDASTGTGIEQISGKLTDTSATATTPAVTNGRVDLPTGFTSAPLAMPAPTWTRLTALVAITNIAPAATAKLSTTTTSTEWTNNTATTATAHFHLPAGSYTLTLNGKPTAYTDFTCKAGKKYTLDARNMPGTGGDESAQAIWIDGTATDADILAAFNTPGITHFIIKGTGTENVKTALNNLHSNNSTKKIHLQMPDVTKVEGSAFEGCLALASIDLPEAIKILYYAFYGCTALTSIDLPKATDIVNNSFEGCTALTTVSLPKAGALGGSAFKGCTALASISMPVLFVIYESVFEGCISLTTVSLPVAGSIGNDSFKGCTALASIDLPEATSIGQRAFQGCTTLASIDLPKTTSIGGTAFDGCGSLTRMELTQYMSWMKVHDGAFNNAPIQNITLVLHGTAWNNFNNVQIKIEPATNGDENKNNVTFNTRSNDTPHVKIENIKVERPNP